ncbi:MAG: hypothetical protein ACK56F_14120, partial [bacterium]
MAGYLPRYRERALKYGKLMVGGQTHICRAKQWPIPYRGVKCMAIRPLSRNGYDRPLYAGNCKVAGHLL